MAKLKSEIFYFDAEGRPVDDQENAVEVIIRELDEDGNLVNETRLLKNK